MSLYYAPDVVTRAAAPFDIKTLSEYITYAKARCGSAHLYTRMHTHMHTQHIRTHLHAHPHTHIDTLIISHNRAHTCMCPAC